MHGKKMDGACETENQHLHLEASPHPFPNVDPMEMVMYPVKKKAKDKIDRRVAIYKDHHKGKKDHYNDVAMTVYAEDIQESKGLIKKFNETKAKKTKKEKGDKNAKKNDVLSVSIINDENRSAAAYHRTTNNVPSVNGGLASPPVKPDQFDRDLPTANATSDAQSSHHPEMFSNRFLTSLDEFPDLLAGAGSLDELLQVDDSQGGLIDDVGNMLDEIRHEMSGDLKHQVDSLDFFHSSGPSNFGASRGDVKLESFLDDISSFTQPADATGTTFSARSAPAAAALAGPNAAHLTTTHQQQQRITPDHVVTKQRLQQHDEMLAHQKHQQNMMMQQQRQLAMQQQQQYLPSQQQQQTPLQQKSISPFGSIGDAPPVQQQQQNMCFSPNIPPESSYPPYPRQQQPVYDANQAAMSRQQAMRMNQGSPGVVGGVVNGRWQGNDGNNLPPSLGYHQQKQMSLTGTGGPGNDLPYGAAAMQQHANAQQMGPGGLAGPGKQVFHQGAPGYPPNQMTHRAQGLSGPYGYVNGNGGVGSSMPRPHQQQQYRGMMPNGQQPVAPSGKMYPVNGVAGAGGPYAGHMQQAAYQQNMHMDQRQMTGYRPPYTQQQPVQVQHQQQHNSHQQQQQSNFMTSSNIHPAAAQQQSFYSQQPNGPFPTATDQMNYQQQPTDMYGSAWSS